MPSVLIVEDETPLAEGLMYSLRREGFDASCVADGALAIDTARRLQPDLILLDLMLPGRQGADICRDLRRESEVPIIMLTAKSAEADRVIGFAIGADDYVCKPFSTPELISRIRAVLRRSTAAGTERREALAYGPIEMNLLSRKVTVRGASIDLTRREFDLLEAFVSSPGRVFTREALLGRVWGETVFIDERTVDVHVRWLRQKIEEVPGKEAANALGIREASLWRRLSDAREALRTAIEEMQR